MIFIFPETAKITTVDYEKLCIYYVILKTKQGYTKRYSQKHYEEIQMIS